jgi:ABC-type sugar transport system permease subunit
MPEADDLDTMTAKALYLELFGDKRFPNGGGRFTRLERSVAEYRDEARRFRRECSDQYQRLRDDLPEMIRQGYVQGRDATELGFWQSLKKNAVWIVISIFIGVVLAIVGAHITSLTTTVGGGP